jgi:polysaccharide biosynthesis protein PslF
MDKRNYTDILNAKEREIRAIYISSYIPDRCGIATFTKDLSSAINVLNPVTPAEIVAVHEEDESFDYPWEVKFRIKKNNISDYSAAEHYIYQSSADIVNLQHEFGLFGGVDGEYILPMIDRFDKPLVTNFHSILPEPDEHKKHLMRRIIDRSDAVIAMTNISRQLLIDVYGCDEDKAVVIYHGVPNFTFKEDLTPYKKKLGITSKYMLMMSGLLGPGKGIEYVIEAMPKILSKFPDTQFFVIGQTHPDHIKDQKDVYREKLESMVKLNKLENNVIFINKYLSLEELKEYYEAADVFLTPHLDPQQPTSGTLSYALGAGNLCISTPYNYAKEVLADGQGIIVPFHKSEPIADEVIKHFSSPELMNTVRRNGYKLGKMMQWPRVARRYIDLFNLVLEGRASEHEEKVIAPVKAQQL